MLQAIIFDLDDTLVESKEGIRRYFSALFEHLGATLPPPEDTEAWTYLYTAPERLTLKRFVDGSEETWQKAVAFKKQLDMALSIDVVTLKKGAREALQWASERYLLALGTGRGASTEPLLERLDISGYFQVIYHAVNSERLKPDPWVVYEVMRQFALRDGEVAFVGDSAHDVSCARNANALSIAVGENWKFGTDTPDIAIPDISHLIATLENL